MWKATLAAAFCLLAAGQTVTLAAEGSRIG